MIQSQSQIEAIYIHIVNNKNSANLHPKICGQFDKEDDLISKLNTNIQNSKSLLTWTCSQCQLERMCRQTLHTPQERSESVEMNKGYMKEWFHEWEIEQMKQTIPVVVYSPQNDDITFKHQKLWKIFYILTDCIEYIQKQTEKVFLVVCSSNDDLISELHKLTQVDYMYTYLCTKVSSDNNRKIRDYFSDSKALEDLLTKDIDIYVKNNICMPHMCIYTVKPSNEQINFMWYQFVIDFLVNTPISTSKNESNRMYDSKVAYSMNEAVRSDNPKSLFKFRSNVCDLCKQIDEKHSMWFQNILYSNIKHLQVYRGQLMSKESLETFRSNIGGFVSMNTCFSATYSLDTARIFAENSSDYPDFESIIFTFTFDPTAMKKPFANINAHDPDELLFSLGTIFRIKSVKILSDQVWSICLIYSKQDDEELTEILSKRYEEAIGERATRLTFGHFLNVIGEQEKAELYSKLLLQELEQSDIDTKNIIYNNVGLVYAMKGDSKEALSYYHYVLTSVKSA
ncbi:unnamed protein product [Didymodactylos carnosus]|uniref:Uncharacterized protein n=1 Tax=Didymodactylos carnosus TaxID=1234261 RepID=A0A8S2D4K9_9BILA|nr:unnamed protein product [Didymodactylos carnosus]CAF3627079.1 unnamed protein product [Didymodactylos carnosus]